ncbi:DNA cross-link repair protein PSO2/SNM1 [Cryptotrichosporon argae]
MARATKKQKSQESPGGSSILRFFAKAPVATSPTNFVNTESAQRKGKARAIEPGSVANPLIISDDEVVTAEPVKRRRSSTLIAVSEEPGSSRIRRLPSPLAAPPSPAEGLPTVTIDYHSEYGRGDGSQHASDNDPNSFVDDEPIELDSGLDIDAGELGTAEPVEPDLSQHGAEQPLGPGDGAPAARSSQNTLDLQMEWDEGDDEGMGMDEGDEGDDEGEDELLATPKSGSSCLGKVSACPVCGMSLRNKVNTIVQHHINTCLDAGGSSPRKRSITSFSHVEPRDPSPLPEGASKGPNAFSLLMSGHKEKAQWKAAEIDLKRDGKRVFGRRHAPFYKVLTGMPIAVDAFRYGAIPKVTAYFLTHAHSDHYTNLSKSWRHGPIYCSHTTANLIKHMLGVEPQWVYGLPDDVSFEIPNTGGVTVTPIEANHCPGSSIFLFEGPQTVNAGDSGFTSGYVGSAKRFRYLHCGDFRASPKHVLHPAVARAKVDTVYLDTTYLNPTYCFPPQPLVIQACATLARRITVGVSADAPTLDNLKPDTKPDIKPIDPDVRAELKLDDAEAYERSKAMMWGWLVKKEEDEKPEVKEELVDINELKPKGRTLVVVGTYSIGKERIVKGVARALGSKIYCDPRKRAILMCQADPELHSMLTDLPLEVHLVPLGNIQLDRLQPYLHALQPHFDRVLAFRPTGWTYTAPAGTNSIPDVNFVIRRDQARTFNDAMMKTMRGSSAKFMLYGVPYSEHSSFFELTCFALSMPGVNIKMIATVNVGNEKSRAKMQKWFEKWAAEKQKRKEKGLPEIVEYRDSNYW